jgi:hypothetical protein
MRRVPDSLRWCALAFLTLATAAACCSTGRAGADSAPGLRYRIIEKVGRM